MSLLVKNLKVSLQKEEILHGIDLDIKSGEFVSLLGASGCGKSTLLKSIAGLLDIEEGEIQVDGQMIQNMAPEKRGTVIVFQDLRLFPHMTVEKNIAFSMSLKGVPKGAQREAVKKLLEDVQLAGFENRKIREMSGGQMQRVALARALAAEPRALLLDEPFSGLDERLRSEMAELVKKLHRERGLTTVLVTHDKHEALKLSDRIVLMKNGSILQYDTPHNIFRHPVSKEVADYFGKMNYIETEDGILGVRPFDIRILPGKNDCTVEEVIFMGGTTEVVLDTPGGIVVCSVISAELDAMGISVGSRVGMEVNDEANCIRL